MCINLFYRNPCPAFWKMAENTSTQDVPDEVDPTQMLANALKRMDGLIGNYSSTVAEGNVSGEYESTGSKICRLCHELRSAIMTYESEKSANNTHIDPRSILPQETCTTILEWLCGNQLQNKVHSHTSYLHHYHQHHHH